MKHLSARRRAFCFAAGFCLCAKVYPRTVKKNDISYDFLIKWFHAILSGECIAGRHGGKRRMDLRLRGDAADRLPAVSSNGMELFDEKRVIKFSASVDPRSAWCRIFHIGEKERGKPCGFPLIFVGTRAQKVM